MTSLYADDPDVHADFDVFNAEQTDLNWSPVQVRTGSTVITATWEGEQRTGFDDDGRPCTIRKARVPLTGLTVGHHDLRLVIPGANDVYLGRIVLN